VIMNTPQPHSMLTPVPVDPSKLPMHLRPARRALTKQKERPTQTDKNAENWSDFYGEFDGAEL
jgi:hypothetical protein